MIRRLSAAKRAEWASKRWVGYQLPAGDKLYADKARESVTGLRDYDWGPLAGETIGRADSRVRPDGIGAGTPVQAGGYRTRTLYWGRPARFEQVRTSIPLPLDGGRYWTTGEPTPYFDRRCILVGPDGLVREMIQFDQDAPRRFPLFAQQAYTFGAWRGSKLLEGVATTAAKLPLYPYIWGPASADNCHTQALVLADYQGGDGRLKSGPTCGDHVALDPDSRSAREMFALGGECAIRAVALTLWGARIIDSSGGAPPSIHTQAGSWTDHTNLAEFSIDLVDLKAVG